MRTNPMIVTIYSMSTRWLYVKVEIPNRKLKATTLLNRVCNELKQNEVAAKIL